MVQVLKGAPTDDELAALVAVLTTAASSAPAAAGPTKPIELWGNPTFSHRGAAPFSPYAFQHLSHLRG
nr:acyl-CoA carboxylase subunit epsilon [Antrihabitans stalactiti]